MSGEMTPDYWTWAFDFQGKLLEMLSIPKEVADRVSEVTIHSATHSAPVATIKFEVPRNDSIEVVTKTYEISEPPQKSK